MRGTHIWSARTDFPRRIIPAYAGNTYLVGQDRFSTSDHPRVCGEHKSARSKPRPCSGSSPRMRGTRNMWCALYGENRIIPAYAGNTQNRNTQYSLCPDHPRVCGEHPHEVRALSEVAGSSPRMRGTRLARQSRPESSRIIPAYAGNTPARNRKRL